MDNRYDEYLVTDGNGNNCGYRNTYVEALSLAADKGNTVIYGKYWRPSRAKGLLVRDWEEVIPAVEE